MVNKPTIYKFFKDFINHWKKTHLVVVFSCTRIQSGPDVFDKSKFVVTILGVTEILCSFRLVPEGKTGKEMLESSKLEFPEKTLAKKFALSDADDNTSWLLNRGGTANLLLLRIILAICQKSWQSSLDFYFISICKFGSLKKPFTMNNSLSEPYFWIRRFILLVQTKKSDFYEL